MSVTAESPRCALGREGLRRRRGRGNLRVPASAAPGVTFTPELPRATGVTLLLEKAGILGRAESVTGRVSDGPMHRMGFGNQESLLP